MKRATAKCLITMSQSRISIHALVKRATMENGKMCYHCWISIHALVKRATRKTKELTSVIGISIHALVKRATV